MKDFIKYLQKKGFSPSTQKSTRRIITGFLNMSQTEAVNIKKKDVLKYLEHLKKEEKENTTINLYLRSLRYYFDFLLESRQIAANPANLIKIRGIKRRKLYRIFTASELAQLADDYYNMFVKNPDNGYLPEATDPYSALSRQRNYCILTFFVYQGLQTAELEKITLRDIDLIKATVNIPAGRRTNARTLHLKAEQIGALMYYLQNVRPELSDHYTGETDRLFLAASRSLHQREADTWTWNVFTHLKTQIQSINAGFSNFKQIRSSVITLWIQTEGLRKAQYYAGHRYTSSTENYLPNDIAQLSDDIEKYNPF